MLTNYYFFSPLAPDSGKLSFLSESVLSTGEEDQDVMEDIEALLAEGSPNPLPPAASLPTITNDLDLDLIICQ